MDIHAEYLSVAGLLRASAAVAPPDAGAGTIAQKLRAIADRIDPLMYAAPTQGVKTCAAGLVDAMGRLSAIPARIRPTTADPIRQALGQLAAAL
jgi:hypothetical protein